VQFNSHAIIRTLSTNEELQKSELKVRAEELEICMLGICLSLDNVYHF